MNDKADINLAGQFDGSRVVITGGLGFVGSNLARTLADAGAVVTAVDSLVPEYGGNSFNLDGYEDRIGVNISDVRDPHSMRHLIHGQDYLFNLAGQTSHMDSMRDPFTDLEINCTSQLSILETCRQCNPDIRIVFASTRQLYGRPEYLPVDEKHPLRPADVNGINKLAGEHYHLLYHRVYNLATTVLRLTNTIGPRMRVCDARQTFVGLWLRLALENQPFEVWGGEQLRDFTYVDDCVSALLLAATEDAALGEVFNVGGCAPVTLRDLADLIVSVNGYGSYVTRQFPKSRAKIDIGDFYSNATFIKERLGFQHSTSLERALALTLAYYRAHLPKYADPEAPE